jgi:hypothetical protein
MTCSEVQEVLPEIMDVPVDGLFPPDFQSHLKTCADCSDLVSDLRSIAGEARHLVANDEPSPQLWLRIAAQLRSEGLIRDQKSDFSPQENLKPVLIRNSPRPRWGLSWLVPVAAMLLVAGTYVVKHQSNLSVSQSQTASNPAPAAAPNSNPAVTASTSAASATPEKAQVAKAPGAVAPGSPTPEQVAQRRRDVEAAPSADDEQFMSVVSSRAPSMKTTYEKQLQAVNADIRESQAYVDQNPADADARQHLMEAYQQKALLYQLALDRIQ